METLNELMQRAWDCQMRNNPIIATICGDQRFNDRLPLLTIEEMARQNAEQLSFLEELQKIDRESLSEEQQINYDLFQKMTQEAIEEYEFKSYLMPISQISGFHIYLTELPNQMPFQTESDYENYIARLCAIENYVMQHIEIMKEGVKQHYTIPQVAMSCCVEGIQALIADTPEKSLFYTPFARIPKNISQQENLQSRGSQAIEKHVLPSFQKFSEFLVNEYLPACRQEIGLSALPNGKKYYEYLVHHFTTLEITPQQVHDIGLKEVERLREEMLAIMQKVEFQGDFSEFVEFLRTSPQFYATTEKQLMAEVSYIMKKMDGLLPSLFRTLPRTPYGIKEVPSFIAPRMPTAYYMPCSGDGTRAGFYYVNTYNLSSRPMYELEALSLHEAVPGHHLQIALQQELKNLPNFRRFSRCTAYIEGWALYSERLGKEVGFYEDPYSDFGRLIYEIWRACRLVVDTGIHYLGWSRQQAIDFMTQHSSLTEHNIATEIDRYISLPGQAISYKIGELKITKLRREAEEQLGRAFDIREFHDVLLLDGAIPLDILENKVNTYIQSKKSA